MQVRPKRPWFDPSVGKTPRGGHDSPLQHSCLGNPMDRGACQVAIHRISQSWIRLKHQSVCGRAHTHTHTHTSPLCSLSKELWRACLSAGFPGNQGANLTSVPSKPPPPLLAKIVPTMFPVSTAHHGCLCRTSLHIWEPAPSPNY